MGRGARLDRPSLPPWLRGPEGYHPKVDRDGFIDKNILALLALLAGSREGSGAGRDGRGPSPHPATRLSSCLLLLLLVSLTRSPGFLALVATLELVLLGLLRGSTIARVLKLGLIAGFFSLVVLLPAALWGGGPRVLLLAAKVLLSVTATALLSASLGWTALARALAALRLPNFLILVLDLALKYISLLGGLVLDLLQALRLRSVGRNRDKGASLSGVAGTVFLRSREAAEEVYAAMECRGFTASYRATRGPSLAVGDYLLLVVSLLLLLSFLFLQGA